jgi:hypothetical protein
MRKQWIGACLLLAGALTGPAANRAMAQWDVSGYPSRENPLPIGPDRPENGGIYGTAEFLFMHMNRNIGSQAIAKRGFYDSDGSVVGVPGQFVGSGRLALDTNSFGRTTWVPGFRVGLGYSCGDGTSISISYVHLAHANYSFSAGPVPPDLNPGNNLADSFISSPVFGFSPQFAGAQNRLASRDTAGNVTTIGSGSSPYGIFNGATTMDISYTERFDNWDITGRFPVFETEYAKTWALAGGRFAWYWEKFKWRSVTTDFNGGSSAPDAANYTNIISQRMYGPFIGAGNEVYLGGRFSLSADITGAILYDMAKERAKYLLGDGSTESKRGRMEYSVVPNVNGSINVWWYPIDNVQVRVGYDLWTFFNTIYMDKPVGFNAGAIDPAYNHRAVRLIHGLQFGVGVNF